MVERERERERERARDGEKLNMTHSFTSADKPGCPELGCTPIALKAPSEHAFAYVNGKNFHTTIQSHTYPRAQIQRCPLPYSGSCRVIDWAVEKLLALP